MVDKWFIEWVKIQHGDHLLTLNSYCDVKAILEKGNYTVEMLYEEMMEVEGTDWIESWHYYLEDRLNNQMAELIEVGERFLESSPCQNNCKPEDMTCDTMFAKEIIKKARGDT